MSDPLDLVTSSEVQRAVAGIPEAKVELIDGYITDVSRHIDDLCGPVVQRTVTAELHHGNGLAVILNRYPVLSVTSVTENGVTLTTADWSVDSNSGILIRTGGTASPYTNQRWQFGQRNVAVTYVAGRYPNTAAVDPLFRSATIMAVKAMWTSQQAITGSQVFGVAGEGFADNSDVPGGMSYVLPKPAYMLLLRHIQSRATFA